MTKVYQEYEVVHQEKMLLAVTCDWCGKVMDTRCADCGGDSYPKTEISFVMVHPCWENTGGEGWDIEDLCEQCGEKLAVLLKDAGIKLGEIDF